MILSKKDKDLIKAVESRTLSFSEACRALGLDPSIDLMGGDFSYVDFTNSNLTGFNFTNADLSNSEGSNISGVKGAIFDGANLKNSPFNSKPFGLPFNFEMLTKYKNSYEPFKINEIVESNLGLHLSDKDKFELLKTLVSKYVDRPDILCSALWMVTESWKSESRRFDIFDKLLVSKFPSVCIQTLKSIERCVTIDQIHKRYSSIIFGKPWLHVRYAAFTSFSQIDEDPYYKPEKPATDESWLDPVDTVIQSPDQKGTLNIYLQRLPNLHSLPSQNGFMTEEGAPFFARLSRKTNLIFRFDQSVRGLNFKRYYGRLNSVSTIDFEKRLFHLPDCFNLLNLLSPEFVLEKKLTKDFQRKNTVIINPDSEAFELLPYMVKS